MILQKDDASQKNVNNKRWTKTRRDTHYFENNLPHKIFTTFMPCYVTVGRRVNNEMYIDIKFRSHLVTYIVGKAFFYYRVICFFWRHHIWFDIWSHPCIRNYVIIWNSGDRFINVTLNILTPIFLLILICSLPVLPKIINKIDAVHY